MKSNKQIKNTGKGGFNFAATGLVALVALGALGGGLWVLLNMSNQNNPTINVQGSSAKSGDTNVTIAPASQQDDSQLQKTESQSQPSEATSSPGPKSDESPQASKTAASQIDLKPGSQWTFKFPLYRMQGNACSLVGNGSVPLVQQQNGALYYSGYHNFYGLSTTIEGTITTFGKTNLSLSTYAAKFVTTFESKKMSSENGEILITGDATALNCPVSKFELRKQSQ
jgi:hypothetical protein